VAEGERADHQSDESFRILVENVQEYGATRTVRSG
jgi:hypothetical protein